MRSRSKTRHDKSWKTVIRCMLFFGEKEHSNQALQPGSTPLRQKYGLGSARYDARSRHKSPRRRSRASFDVAPTSARQPQPRGTSIKRSTSPLPKHRYGSRRRDSTGYTGEAATRLIESLDDDSDHSPEDDQVGENPTCSDEGWAPLSRERSVDDPAGDGVRDPARGSTLDRVKNPTLDLLDSLIEDHVEDPTPLDEYAEYDSCGSPEHPVKCPALDLGVSPGETPGESSDDDSDGFPETPLSQAFSEIEITKHISPTPRLTGDDLGDDLGDDNAAVQLGNVVAVTLEVNPQPISQDLAKTSCSCEICTLIQSLDVRPGTMARRLVQPCPSCPQREPGQPKSQFKKQLKKHLRRARVHRGEDHPFVPTRIFLGPDKSILVEGYSCTSQPQEHLTTDDFLLIPGNVNHSKFRDPWPKARILPLKDGQRMKYNTHVEIKVNPEVLSVDKVARWWGKPRELEEASLAELQRIRGGDDDMVGKSYCGRPRSPGR